MSSEEEFSGSESDEEYRPLRLEHGSHQRYDRQNPKSTASNVLHVCSFLLGATLAAPFMVIICSAQDMLSGSKHATGLVVIAATAPACFMKLCFLLCGGLRKTSIVVKTLFTYVLLVLGLLLVAFSQTDIRVRYMGVCLVSLGTSVGEIALLILAATKFHERALSSLVTGTAIGGVLSTVPYVGMTSWSDVNPRAALLVPTVWPSLYLLIFAVMQIKNFGKPAYKSALQTVHDEPQPKDKTFLAKRFMAVWKVLDNLLLLCVSYFSAFLSIAAILPTLVFTHTNTFGPREDYQHYILCMVIGQFFGRSFMSLLLAKVPRIRTPFQVMGVFFPTFIMFIFFFGSWNRYIHSIVYVFVLCFFQGTFLGILTVISYQSISDRTHESHVGFVLMLASLLETFGILCAGLIGLHTEPSLYKHCFEFTHGDTRHCLTRSSNSQLWIKGKSAL